MINGKNTPDSRLDLAAFFNKLAVDVAADLVRPLFDGSLLFAYTTSGDHARIVWKPRLAPGGISIGSLGGSFFADGPRGELLRSRLRTIARVLHHPEERNSRRICPLHVET